MFKLNDMEYTPCQVCGTMPATQASWLSGSRKPLVAVQVSAAADSLRQYIGSIFYVCDPHQNPNCLDSLIQKGYRFEAI